MRKLYKSLIAAVAVAACAASFSGIYAYFSDSADIKITSYSGNVNVNMDLLQRDLAHWGAYKEFEAPEFVMPESTVEEIMKLNNNGLSCYVRLKLELESSNADLVNVDIYDCYDYDHSIWVQKGGYLYYKNVLNEPDESITVFNNFTVPSGLTQKTNGETFKTKITVDAVQAENFTPDFESDEPWGNIVPQASAVRTY